MTRKISILLVFLLLANATDYISKISYDVDSDQKTRYLPIT